MENHVENNVTAMCDHLHFQSYISYRQYAFVKYYISILLPPQCNVTKIQTIIHHIEKYLFTTQTCLYIYQQMTIISGLAAQYTNIWQSLTKIGWKVQQKYTKNYLFRIFRISYKIGAYKRCLKQLQYKSILLLIGHPNILR